MTFDLNSLPDETDATDAPTLPSALKFPVVGVGASAGCVAALVRLFEGMPDSPGMAFVVVVHLSPEHESHLDAILGRVTRMPVAQVQETVAIEPDHIYVIPPSRQLTMSDGHLRVEPITPATRRTAAIDLFFRTLADAHRELAISVVLSGTGADGSLGLRRIKERGGVTFAQSPDDAEYDGMPSSAMASGAIDFVMPAADMGRKLVELWKNIQRIELPEPVQLRTAKPPPTPEAAEEAEQALADILQTLLARTGHDFRNYKRATVLRRIERRLQINGLATLSAYRTFLEAHAQETAALLKDLLISVTNFFRDREAFDALEAEIEKSFFAANAVPERLRAWVAGCATGEEAYSLAIMLSERATASRVQPDIQLFASDIDERAIAVARAGLYPESIATDVSVARLRDFFQHEDGHYRIRKSLREKILFATHNLLRDPPFSRLDLVCCRNLLIYLDREVQARVLQMFHFALRPGGLLFLGLSESAEPAGDLFVAVDKKNRIYRADGARRAHTRELPMLQAAAVPAKAELPRPVEVRSVLAELHDRLRLAHAQPSVLVDGAGAILHCSELAADYLRFAPGNPSKNLHDVIRPELRLSVDTALFEASRDRKSVEGRGARLEIYGRTAWVTPAVRPVHGAGAPLLLVTFSSNDLTLGFEAEWATPDRDPMVGALEDELLRTREQLSSSVGASAESSEALRASNEELQAINEELRSTTEELETGKEELQSVNEELVTVNQELKMRVEEAGKINDDLRNLVSSTDIATIFVDRALRIKRYTPRASRLFNLIASDIDRSLLDITHRLDYDELEHDTMEAFESLRSIEREVHGEDGSVYLVRVLPYRTQHDVIDGAVLTFVDVSALRRTEEQVRIGEANLRLVAESTQDYAIITMDTEGRITAWNRGAERIFGFGESEMMGRPIDVIFTPEDQAAGIPGVERERARTDGRAADERWHQGRDGRRFFCSGIMTPLHRDGVLVGYAKIARDLSEAKRAEAHLDGLLQQESRTRTELQRAMALKDEFLAVMSHELKQPLNLIHVSAELLARLPEVRAVPGVARAADVIRRTVQTQARMIDDLLDLSRLRTGKLSLATETFDWAAQIEREVGAISGDVLAAGLTMETDLHGVDATVDADPARLEQIVWNLLTNAIKFTPTGGRIFVRLSADGAQLRLDVVDSGQGIDADFLPQVFEMFRQAGIGTTRRHGGMGIGLALVRQLAEAHGGRVAATSDGAGRGATFSVWLPHADTAPGDAPCAPEGPVLASMRVLLVDDTLDALESFATLLRLEGARVTTASSGAQALEAVEADEFDLLLSDIAMPGMDGYELIARLRARPQTTTLPAVALTGFGRPRDAQRATQAGFDAHLAKPVMVDELLQVVRSLPLDGHRQPADRKDPDAI